MGYYNLNAPSLANHSLLHRQKQAKRRALPGFALHLNAAAMLFDDAIDDRQAQARARALGFRGEEWIEDRLHILARYAFAGVAHATEACKAKVATSIVFCFAKLFR